MNSVLRAFLVALAVVALPTVASAQDGGRAPAREGRQIDGRTVYTWDTAEAVEGSGTSPYGELMRMRRRMRRDSLVRIRQNFIPEALKSVENI
ncbi:MAG: hypothetical protein IT379_21705 [Deltaproteobacteria bacterium]|nr:hypothetical protein [Deltaproteobacteria bacterium]